jgi:Gpi18-like mannosyltransferase
MSLSETRKAKPDIASVSDVGLGRSKLLPGWFGRDILIPFAITRAGLIVAAWLGFYLVHLPVKNIQWEIAADGNVHSVEKPFSEEPYRLINMWSRWDGGWYLNVAQHGYQRIPGQQSTVAFFPLYPSLIRAVHYVIPLRDDAGWLLIGIILSNAALLAALIYLYRLVRLDHERDISARSVLYFCVFPMTLFLSAVYSESLFLALVVASFYYARSNRWFIAGALAAAAALTRSIGVLLVIPLALEYLLQRDFRWRLIRSDCLALSFSPIALAAHLTFLRLRFGEWDTISKAETTQGWHRHLTAPWNTFWYSAIHISSSKGYHGAVELLFAIGFLALTIYAFLRLRSSYATYAAISFLFATSWGTLISTPRFVLANFPVFVSLALLGRHKVFDRSFIIVSSILASVSMVVFSQWGWVS